MKKICLLTLTALLAFILASCGSPAETSKITVVLDWTPNTNHAGLYAAQSEGYFSDAGLTVEIVQPPEDGALPMTASGNAQFGISFQEEVMIAVTAEKPLDIVTMAAVLQHNTSGIISLKEKGITRPSKLENHSYASYQTPSELAILKSVVEKDGGDFDKVQIIPNTAYDAVSALQTDVDGIWVYYAWDGIACEVFGLDTNYFAFRDIDPALDFYTPVIASSGEYVKANPDKAAEILAAAAPEIDGELLKASMAYIAPKYIDDANSWGEIDPQRWDRFNAWMFESGLLSRKPAPSETLWKAD